MYNIVIMELHNHHSSQQFSEIAQLSGDFRLEAEAAGVVPPAITSNHPLDTMLVEYEHIVAIDETALLGGLVDLDVTKQVGLRLYSDWQEDSSRSELWTIESTYGEDLQTVTQPSGAHAKVAPYAATIKLGQNPNHVKNEQQANRAFWTGVIACSELDNQGMTELDRDRSKETQRKRDRMSLILPSGFVFANIMTNSFVRKSLDITTYDYAQVVGVAVVVGAVMAPPFIYAQIKNSERRGASAAEFLTNKHKNQAAELAAAYPALRINSATKA